MRPRSRARRRLTARPGMAIVCGLTRVSYWFPVVAATVRLRWSFDEPLRCRERRFFTHLPRRLTNRGLHLRGLLPGGRVRLPPPVVNDWSGPAITPIALLATARKW